MDAIHTTHTQKKYYRLCYGMQVVRCMRLVPVLFVESVRGRGSFMKNSSIQCISIS